MGYIMLAVLSPAKTLDFESPLPTRRHSQPAFMDETSELVRRLRALSPSRLGGLLGVSAPLAQLNCERYRAFSAQFNSANARPAVLAFKGDVYRGLRVEDFSAEDFRFAQRHLRILSGLYGLLRPLDLIQPYRLEMGTRLAHDKGEDLYAFWSDRLATATSKALRTLGGGALLNLASNEYFKVLAAGGLAVPLIAPAFLDYKNGRYKMISFYAKRARGAMAGWVVRQRVEDAARVVDFAEDGYRYSAGDSTGDRPVFTRHQAQA